MADRPPREIIENHQNAPGSIAKHAHSDNAKEFIGSVVRELNQLLGIKHVTGTSYHPQSQGYIEGRHKTVNNVLRAYTTNVKNWSRWIKLAQWVMRSTPRADRCLR